MIQVDLSDDMVTTFPGSSSLDFDDLAAFMTNDDDFWLQSCSLDQQGILSLSSDAGISSDSSDQPRTISPFVVSPPDASSPSTSPSPHSHSKKTTAFKAKKTKPYSCGSKRLHYVLDPVHVIPCDDFRRNLGPAFLDAINQGDSAMLQSLLRAHCTKDVSVTLEYSEYCHVRRQLSIRGLPATVAYACALQCAIPDGVAEIRSNTLRALADGSCTIIISANINGNKVLDVVGDSGCVVLTSRACANGVARLMAFRQLFADMLDSVAGIFPSLDEKWDPIPLRESASSFYGESLLTQVSTRPVFFRGSTRITLSLDPQKRVSSIHILYCDFDK